MLSKSRRLLLALCFLPICCFDSRNLRDASSPTNASVVSDATITTQCPLQCQNGSQFTSSTNSRVSFRIFYLIVVHNHRTLNDAVHLIRAIRNPRNILLVHVDVKAQNLVKDSALEQEIATCPCGAIILVRSVHDAQWSHWSMNLPTLYGLRTAVLEYDGLWDVFINLSGDTLPVYKADPMADILSRLKYNFVTSSSCATNLLPTSVYAFPTWWHKRAHYTEQDTIPDPVFAYKDEDGAWNQETVVTHFGSQWMVLQPDFCAWIVRGLERPDSLQSQFRDYLIQRQVLMTDETFFSSLLMHSKFNTTLPKVDDESQLLRWNNGSLSDIRAIRYERMDEHVPTALGQFPVDQRYDVPESSGIDKPHHWGPYFLGVYDLANIRTSGALFIRKLSADLDPNMIRLFPVNRAQEIPWIQWPNEVAIIPKPNWEKTKAILLANQDEPSNDDEEL